MSSGVRVTVALVVVAFVAIGLYYASLDMPEASAPSFEEPLLRSEDTPAPSGEGVVDLEAIGEEWEHSDGLDTDVLATEDESDFEIEFSDVPQAGASQEDVNSGEVKEDDVVSVVTEVDGIDSEDDVIVEVADELISQEESPVLPKNERDVRESIGVPSKGVMYGISASRFTAGIDVDEVIASFDPSSASSAPSGTAWVRMAPWVSVPESIEQPWIVTTAGDITWALVRDDEAGSMRLEGNVTSSRAYIDRTLNQPRIEFVLGEESPTKMTKLTSDNIGRGLAIIIDGEVVFAQSALNVQGGKVNFLPSCDNESAAWIARRIKGEYEPRVFNAVEDTSPENEPAASGVPKGGMWIVSKGDTLSSIAEEWFGDANKFSLIENANPGIDSSNLSIGDEIILPPRSIEDAVVVSDGDHIVASGETLSSISLAYYGSTKYWQRIYAMNRSAIGDDPEKLAAGVRLKMPKISE